MWTGIEDQEKKKEQKQTLWKVNKKIWKGDMWLRFRACLLIGKCKKQCVDRKWSHTVGDPSFGVRHITLVEIALRGNPSDSQRYSFLNSVFRNDDGVMWG